MNTSFHVIENSSWLLTSKDSIFNISNAAISATVNNEVFSLIGDLQFENAQAFGRNYDQTISTKKFKTFLSNCRFSFYKNGYLSISVTLENCS
ncbi:MAG TPA: hypothetical protein DDZ89_07380, partial [Clostridiales bacterium]|nr:hypothetical protein [Clostridiales bacterium]